MLCLRSTTIFSATLSTRRVPRTPIRGNSTTNIPAALNVANPTWNVAGHDTGASFGLVKRATVYRFIAKSSTVATVTSGGVVQYDNAVGHVSYGPTLTSHMKELSRNAITSMSKIAILSIRSRNRRPTRITRELVTN